MRIGFEFARSDFEWRIDERPWKKVIPDDLTTDLMEMGFWSEIAWLKMGDEELSAGSHRLLIRLPKTKNEKGQWQRVLYTSDARCLCQGTFHPNSQFKPGESGRVLFSASREKKKTSNDSDRLRKYLASFNLKWADLKRHSNAFLFLKSQTPMNLLNNREPKEQLRQKFAGVLLGTAVGDALGLPAEGLSQDKIRRRWGGEWRWR